VEEEQGPSLRGREVESGGENGDGLDNANDGEPYPRIKSDRDFGKK